MHLFIHGMGFNFVFKDSNMKNNISRILLAAFAPGPDPVAPPPPAAPAADGKPLPLGTVVTSLPAGCTTKPVGGVSYYYCGGNYYRAVFQGNNLLYVTAKP